jgi:hypothetical protein
MKKKCSNKPCKKWKRSALANQARNEKAKELLQAMTITLYTFDPLPLSITNNYVHTLNKNNSSTLDLVECIKSNLMCEHELRKLKIIR